MAGFNKNSAKRIAKVVRRVEGLPRGQIGTRTPPTVVPIGKYGITTTTLTARSSKTAGYGNIQPYTFNGTIFVLTGSPVKIFNWTGSVIASNLWINYVSADGYLFFNGNDCSGVAP
jgi:hypothetical protein